MKKLNDKQLTQVRAYLESYDATAPHRNFLITAEHVAKRFDLPIHIVEQAFHKLNLEGRISTPDNSANHIMGYDHYPAATAYRLRSPCCDNENRSMDGGCLSCGDPCL